MFKKLLIVVCLIVGGVTDSLSQVVFEYEECNCDNTIYPESKIDGEKKGVIVVYSEVKDLSFEMSYGKKRLLGVKHQEGKYILIVEPLDSLFINQYGKYDILVRATGFQERHIYVYEVNPGSMCSFCCILRSPIEDPTEKLARITVYDKDNKLLVGAVVKNKTTGRVYGSTRYDGTLAINFDNKGESANVIVSHPSYSDTKEIIVQAGIHDYKVNLRNYSPPSKQKTNAMWYIVPGLGEIEFGRKVEGGAIIAGEALLLGGGVISSVAAKKQLEIMRDVDVSLEDFMNAKSKYGTLRTVNVVCYVGAAALYGFHLYRVYHLSKEARNKRHASLTPTIMSIDESMALGLSININF